MSYHINIKEAGWADHTRAFRADKYYNMSVKALVKNCLEAREREKERFLIRPGRLAVEIGTSRNNFYQVGLNHLLPHLYDSITYRGNGDKSKRGFIVETEAFLEEVEYQENGDE